MTILEQIHFECPALLISALKQCRKSQNSNWDYDIKAMLENKEIFRTINFQCMYTQGFIDQKPCEDVIILRDNSGKVKLSNCTSAIAGNDKLVKGDYCGVDGTLIRETGLPEISTHKIKKIYNPELSTDFLFKSWSNEVKDFKLFVLDILKPDLEL